MKFFAVERLTFWPKGQKVSLSSFKCCCIYYLNPSKFYRTVSKEELNAALGKAEAKISEDKNVKEETKNQAMDMAKGLAEGASYEDVKGIGNAASWDARDNALIILIGDKTLKIVSSVSADSETNKALAIKLASEVLAKCN
jgi:hypothetical protein